MDCLAIHHVASPEVMWKSSKDGFLRESRGNLLLYATAVYNLLMFWTYILENQNDRSWYIGYTSNLKKRLADHLSGNGAETTKKRSRVDGSLYAKKWKLIYCEGYLNMKDAKGRERFLKSGSGRKYIKKQLANYLLKN